MTGKRGLAVILLAAIVFSSVLSACSREQKAPSLLTEEQLASDHVTLEEELTDKVTVDAEITPYERYREGLRTYYPAQRERDWVPEEEFMAHPSFGEVPLEEIIEYLRGCSTLGEETARKWHIEDALLNIDLADTQCAGTREMLLGWVRSEGMFDRNYPPMMMYSYTFSEEMDHNSSTLLVGHYSAEGGELPFAAPEEAEKQAREVLEKMTGLTISDYCVYTAVDEEAREILRREGMIPNDNIPEESREYEETDYYTFFFYQDVDGFPWRYLNLNVIIDGEADIGSDVAYDPQMRLLSPIFEQKKMVSVDASGIRCVLGNVAATVGEVCRERQRVYDVGEILEKVREYFGKSLVAHPIVITDIELAYTGWFTDPSEGTMHNIIAPFWVVRYRDKEGISKSQTELIFNAYTGEFMRFVDYQM